MEPHVADLIDALPEETKHSEGAAGLTLAGLLKDLGKRRVPVGRFWRGRALGTLQAKIAAAYLAYWIRTSYKGVDEKQQRLNETHLKAAIELLGSMSYLRGAVMKFGQLIANYPYVAPQEFADVLGRLHFEAPPMHFSLLREFVRNELGADPEELFDGFEAKAFAAASLGQVHRARLKGAGEQVAIKIQYPSIRKTIHDDFANMRALLFPMRLSGDWDNLKLQFEEMCNMLELEADYENEAENLAMARNAFSDDEGIFVPKVHAEFSTGRVLTMDHVDGVHLAQFMATDPLQETRDQFGEKIVLAAARLWYRKNLLYADPHPGNYYFMPDGRLGLVDFGCCHRFTEDDIDFCNQIERAAHSSKEDLRKALIRAADMTPKQQKEPERLQLLEKLCEWLWEPNFHEGAFDFSDPDYFRRGLETFGEIMRRRYIRTLPVNIWLDRNFFGLRALLFRLRARVDLGGILRRESMDAQPVAGALVRGD